MKQMKKVRIGHNSRTLSLSLVALSVMSINSLLISSFAIAESIVLDAVVVTGEKINKGIKDTATAITVINADKLASGETKKAKDVALQAPNVVTDSFGSIAIRGVSGGGAANGGVALITGSRARIATVIDGSTQDWSGYNFTPSSVWDVEQVEVLRGPQSTTQGASAIAGAVVINTNDPTFEKESAVRAGLEHYKNGHQKFNIAAMSSGTVVDNELAYRVAIDDTKGEGWLNYDSADYKVPNLSESESLNVRGKLLWEPEDIPELSAKLTVNHKKNDGEHARFASNTDKGRATQTLDLTPAIARLQDSEENAFAIDIDYQLSSGITNSLHISQTDSDVYADGYRTSNVYSYDIQQKSTSLENRIVFNGDNAKLTGVVGLFLASKESSIYADQGFIIDTAYTTDIAAVYGESSYAFSSKAKATVGIRIENEAVDKAGAVLGRDKIDQDSNNTYYLPKFGMTYEVSDSTTVGATIRKGYSPGGSGLSFPAGILYSYDNEEVTSFELSSKSHFSQATVNANVFYNDYTDYQDSENFAVRNVDNAHIFGMELEAVTLVNNNLQLRGAVGLLHSEIDTDESYKGNELSSVPESNLSVGFTQYIGENWSFGADITHVGEYYSKLANTTDSIVGDYVVTDVRAQYTSGNLTIDGYIKNVTNEDAVYYRADSLASVGQTQTVGVSATYRM